MEGTFGRESKRIETEIRDLGRLAPEPAVPARDAAKLMFVSSGRSCDSVDNHSRKARPAADVFRDIVLENRTIAGLTLAGAALADCVFKMSDVEVRLPRPAAPAARGAAATSASRPAA
jgi:hypothetical protein